MSNVCQENNKRPNNWTAFVWIQKGAHRKIYFLTDFIITPLCALLDSGIEICHQSKTWRYQAATVHEDVFQINQNRIVENIKKWWNGSKKLTEHVFPFWIKKKSGYLILCTWTKVREKKQDKNCGDLNEGKYFTQNGINEKRGWVGTG